VLNFFFALFRMHTISGKSCWTPALVTRTRQSRRLPTWLRTMRRRRRRRRRSAKPKRSRQRPRNGERARTAMMISTWSRRRANSGAARRWSTRTKTSRCCRRRPATRDIRQGSWPAETRPSRRMTRMRKWKARCSKDGVARTLLMTRTRKILLVSVLRVLCC
jgi:hypothetical protein